MIVVDASVAVKWFVPEPETPEAYALFVSDEPRAAPEHLIAEVGQALLRHHREHGLPLAHCGAALSRIRRLVRLFSTEALAHDAREIAAEGGCSVYDALYVAAAERWDGVVVTADAKLVAKLTRGRWQSRVRLLAAQPSET
jgi:predicted nucleic acid-binding protein